MTHATVGRGRGRRRGRRLLFVGMMMAITSGLIGLTGCTPPNEEKQARETFSKKKSCPIDRVTSKARPDLSAHDQTFGGVQKATPPPEIASDPARVAMWEKERAERRQKVDANETVYEVKGCNDTQLYTCSIGHGNHGTAEAMCSPIIGSPFK